jgi:hypothetical protein
LVVPLVPGPDISMVNTEKRNMESTDTRLKSTY